MSSTLQITVDESLSTAPWIGQEPARLLETASALTPTTRYEMGNEIARGGMGAVHRCVDRQLGRELAAKILLAELADSPVAVRRFLEEAQVASQLQHPGVVPIHELGKLPDGRLFFTMKLVQGRTLAAILAERDRPEHSRSGLLKIFEQICQTLAYAHARGVIHRDLKPGNVMVGAFGEVQVMDWGLAKVLAQAGSPDPVETAPSVATVDDSNHTQAGVVLGTFAYMPPEQAQGHADRTDERGDVFGLGALLYEILTGYPPYWGKTRQEVQDLSQQANLQPALERLGRCDVDGELIALCRRCLAVAPEGRPRDARVVAEAVTAYLAGVADRLRQAEIDRAASEARALAERGRRRVTLALGATVLVVLLGAGGIWAWVQESRRVRVEQTTRAVTGPLSEARSLKQRADRQRWQTLVEWREADTLRNEALTVALQAELALEAGEADAGVRQELQDLLPVLRDEAATARRNREMLERLQAISFVANDALNDDDFDYSSAQLDNEDRFILSGRTSRAEYAKAFQNFGIDVLDQPVERVATLLDREVIRPALGEALTDWLRVTEHAPEREQLEAVLLQVERDPFRRRVLQSVRRTDRADLLALAQDARTPGLPLPLLLHLAEALFFNNESTVAIGLLRRTQTAQPGEFWLSNKLGEYLMHTGIRTPVRVAEATRYFTAALVIRPESQVARINLGDALMFLGSYEEALETYRLALSKGERVFGQTKLALGLATAGYHDEALEVIQVALQRRPGSSWVQDSYGSVCAIMGREADAEKAFRAAIAIHPHLASYHSSLGQILTALTKHDEAVAAHRRAVQLRRTGFTCARLAEALLMRNLPGDKAEALKWAQESIRLQPGSSTALMTLGTVHLASGRRDLAITHMREAVRVAPHDSGAWWRLGETYRRTNRLEEATQAMREALQRAPLAGPRRASIVRELGQILLARGDRPGSLGAFSQATELVPRDAGAWADLGDAHRKFGNDRAAGAAYHEALYLNSAHVPARTHLVELSVERGQIDEALALCAEAPEEVQREFILQQARLLLAEKKPEEARKVLVPLTARVNNPDGAAAHLRGLALRQLGLLNEAIDAFNSAIRAKPVQGYSYIEPTLDLADALLERGRDKGDDDEVARGYGYRGWALATSDLPYPALEAYREAVRLAPEVSSYRASLGETLLKAHQPEAALNVFDEGLKSAPREARLLRGRGIALHQLGKLHEAIAVLEAAQKADPKDRKTTLALAEVLRDVGAFRDAADLLERAGEVVQSETCRQLEIWVERLAKVAADENDPEAEEALLLAEVAVIRDRPALATRFFAGSLHTDDPSVDRRLRDLAIEAAVRAGCGEGDGKGLPERRRAEHREEALGRLQMALLLATQQMTREAGPDRVVTLAVIGDLRGWLRSSALRGVREPAALERLPERERRRWKTLWEEVDALLRLAEVLHGRNQVSRESEPL